MYFSSDCFLESVGNCQPEKFVKNRKNIKVSPHFGVSVPYFHGRYSEGHFEVRAMSGRGSTKSERYLPTTNEKPSETMFQRVLLDFVLKTFGRGAENETRTRDPNLGKVVLYQLSYFRKIYVNILGFLPPCQGWKYLFLLGKVALYQLSYFRKMFNLNNQYLLIASAKIRQKIYLPKLFSKKI